MDSVRALLKGYKGRKLTDRQQVQRSIIEAVLDVTQVNLFVISGAISMASTKLMTFYKSVHPYISEDDCCGILERAFYPVLVGMLGKAYLPKHACRSFNLDLDMTQMIAEAHEREPDCDYGSDEADEDDYQRHPQFYTEWDREEITDIKKNRE